MKDYCEYDKDRALPYDFKSPAGFPKDYNELNRMYGKYILDTLRKHNKVDRNQDDLLQGVWVQILKAQVLSKFRDGAARRLPLTMTGGEAATFLGFRWSKWLQFIYSNEHALYIEPLEGNRSCMLSVWQTADLCDLDYALFCTGKVKGDVKRVRPRVSIRGFKTYLQMTVHNAFANMCRTKSRRHKEHVLTPSTFLSQQSDGSFKQSCGVENASSWEANIAAAMTDEEALLDAVTRFRDLDIDLSGPDGLEIIDHMVQQGKRDGGPEHNITLLEFLGQGYGLRDAIRKTQVVLRMKAVG